MVDIHAHILPGADDGPKTLEESMELIKQSIIEGITDIIVTPHAFSPHYDVPAKLVKEKIELLTVEINKYELPIKIHAGQEVRIQHSTGRKISEGEVLPLASSKYILIELPSEGIPLFTVPVIQEIIQLDKIPVIAHPERNRTIANNPQHLMKLIKSGAIAQITAGSVAGHFGKNIQKISLQLVDANLVHAYGSDVHSLTNRPLLFDEGLSYLEKYKRLDAVDIFLENNFRILNNSDVILLEPTEVPATKWWKLFH
ncbi:tyrosine-protein phosphatase [Bacillus sp. FJAT-22090]|uniref:tyrosine-protein phosphatase n=1 Tax=Bacillus sp. FJAT-22090 TaxID=1581038 RepID=UPI0011A17644|nr:CpsB/CapC family capsule biosynthesis tyrosine phosphatase [Bacillus sp. FJAT-22090]